MVRVMTNNDLSELSILIHFGGFIVLFFKHSVMPSLQFWGEFCRFLRSVSRARSVLVNFLEVKTFSLISVFWLFSVSRPQATYPDLGWFSLGYHLRYWSPKALNYWVKKINSDVKVI